MKKIFKTVLKYYLKLLVRLVLLIYRPRITAIAGSVNKGFVKEEIVRVLQEKKISARADQKNFNTEIGLPLAILNLPSGYNSFEAWWSVLKNSLSVLAQKNYPKYLVLELGTSDPGDMDYLLSLVSPEVAVITDITQRYLEGFSDMDQLVREYECLVRKIPESGLVILNADNNRVAKLRERVSARVVAFGFSEDADFLIKKVEKKESGQSIVYCNQEGEEINLEINKFGQHNVRVAVIGEIIKKSL